jgi:cytidylate kinase
MYEDKISFFSSMLNEMLSGFPGPWTLIHKTGQTILQLASLGNVIIIGRGGNIITQNLSNTFHVRLIAPLYERVKTFADVHKIDYRKAKSLIEQHDLSRMKYVHSIFNKKIDDPSLYHLFINTKGLSCKQIANIIGLSVMHRFPEKYELITNSLQVS